MKRMNFPGRVAERNAQAEARQAKYDKLSFNEKVLRAGKKQREKLLRK